MTTILVVDDNEQNLYQLQVLLRGNGYQVESAANGAEALVMARRTPPDLVISDILMPVMDGFALCREWRKDERLRDIPLVFYTATYTDDRDREFALGLGADRFVVKPEEPEVLLEIVREAVVGHKPVGGAGQGGPVGDETVFLKEYNQTLVRKLEAKLMQLEATRHELELDIAERKRAEQTMRVQSAALNAAANAIVITDRDGGMLWVNSAFETLTGFSAAEVLGRNPRELVKSGQHDPAFYSELWETILAGRVWRGDVINRRKNGSLYTEEMTITPVPDESGFIAHFIAVKSDITQRRRLEQALRESRQRLVSIYDTVGDTIFLVAIEADGGFRFESVNKRFVATTGLPAEAVIGKRIEEVIPAESLPLVVDRYRQAVREKAVVRWEETSDYPVGRLTGEVSVAPLVDEQGRCTHLVGAVHDITERKRAEEMLRQSQRLESVGRLAGGVAHDFNNILGVILGYGELMRLQIGEGHPARQRLEQVIRAAERASGLTRQLLAFSRKQVMQSTLLDLSAVVRDMRPMLDRVVEEDLEIVVISKESLGAVQADLTQIEQVIMNLVVNSRDAMREGGCLTIETANAELDQAYASAHPPALPGHYVMLAVSDTGTGMDAETQRRIFEPFFTTKAPGEGTGLGLATVYGIVKQLGGHIWVYSEVGHGSCFRVYLPRVEETTVTSAASAPPEPPPRGHETILVVEDSESLRDLIDELLTEQGYTVLSVTQGEEALALIQEGKHPVDLVLTDVVMPKLGGGDLVKRLKAIRPSLSVLYMSGYASGALSKQGLLGEAALLIEKPFTADKLARTVRLVLDRRPVDGSGKASD